MIFQIYKGMNELPESNLGYDERELQVTLQEILTPFPVHRIRIRKDYSTHNNEISIDIELDSTLTSESLYNKIVYRIFNALDIDMITLQNQGNQSNFSYFFYGEKTINDYKCSIFIDVPTKAYITGEGQLK